MLLGAGSPSRSVRDAPAAGRSTIPCCSSAERDTRSVAPVPSSTRVERLRAWTDEHFPGAVETHAWSAQDYSSHDGVPFVGPLPRGGGQIFVATGFDKWGMTNGVAAALDLTGQILGESPSWAKPLHRRVTRRAARAAGEDERRGRRVHDRWAWPGPSCARLPRSAPGRRAGRASAARASVPVGRSTVDGETCSVVALCTHLGGALKWNDFAESWDCPLHGSRFSPTGEVLEGPATRPLREALSRGPRRQSESGSAARDC